MPAKKGKRENVKSDTVAPENTEEPVVKKGRAGKEAVAATATTPVAAEKVEKPKKGAPPKGKAKKSGEDEVPPVVDAETVEETNEVEKNGAAQEDKPKRGRGKKDAAKKTDADETVEKRETRSRKAKQPVNAKDEPAPKVSKSSVKAPAKSKPAKEPKGKAPAKEEEEPEAPEAPKEAPKAKGKAKGRGKQAPAADENVVDERGDAKVGTAAEGPEGASIDVEACKS